MAASADQNPPVSVELSATAGNDSRVSDVAALELTASDYLATAGYRVSLEPLPRLPMGAATGRLEQFPELPFSAKMLVYVFQYGFRKERERRRLALEAFSPSVRFSLSVKPDCGLHDSPTSNTFGGLVGLLPDLAEHLRDKHPHRRYSFAVRAPASPTHRSQFADLDTRDLNVSRLLKLIRAASDPKSEDGCFFRFSKYFPHTLMILPSGRHVNVRAKPMSYTSTEYP